LKLGHAGARDSAAALSALVGLASTARSVSLATAASARLIDWSRLYLLKRHFRAFTESIHAGFDQKLGSGSAVLRKHAKPDLRFGAITASPEYGSVLSRQCTQSQLQIGGFVRFHISATAYSRETVSVQTGAV
jgi:hypothetical protein